MGSKGFKVDGLGLESLMGDLRRGRVRTRFRNPSATTVLEKE